jgi:hypothetical protein
MICRGAVDLKKGEEGIVQSVGIVELKWRIEEYRALGLYAVPPSFPNPPSYHTPFPTKVQTHTAHALGARTPPPQYRLTLVLLISALFIGGGGGAFFPPTFFPTLLGGGGGAFLPPAPLLALPKTPVPALP